MGQKDSRPSNDFMSSTPISHTGHKDGARHNEGLLTSALLIPQSAKMSKLVKKATLMHQCTDCEYQTPLKRLFEEHRRFHDEKSAHKCPWCSFSCSSMTRLAIHVRYYHIKTDKKALTTTEKQSNSVAKKRAEEWQQFPSGQRIKYKFCADCNFKTTANLKLNVHIKLMHPFSTTALQTLTLEKEKFKFNCILCPFKTCVKTKFERHDACHGNQSASHRCHLCNYSVNNRGHLALHLKLHYLEMDENKINDQLNTEKDRDKNSTSRTSRNNRRSLLSCQECRLFKTTSRFTLRRHVKKAHPFSLSALPPLLKKRKRNSHPLKKSDLKVVQKVQQPVSEESREEWYIPPSGKRNVYCADYMTTTRTKLNQHARAKHLTSTTAILAKPTKELRAACRYHADPNQDSRGKEDHRKFLNLQETRIQEVPSEARLRGQFGIKECTVVLHHIQTLSTKVVIPENTELLPLDKESDKITDVPNPGNAVELPSSEEGGNQIEDEVEGQRGENGKIQLLQSQLKITEEETRIADEKLKQISSKKIDVQKKIEDMAERRALILYNLLLEQRNLLEMQLTAHETGEETSEILKQSVEEEVKSLEDERDVVEGALQTLKEEAKNLDQNLEEARGSHFQVVQVLKALQSELDGLLSNICV